MLLCRLYTSADGQRLLSLAPADSLHKGRLWFATGTGTVLYGASMIGLYKTWYDNYPLGRFHSFNDWQEWKQMDKAGHVLTAYQESRWIAGIARWTGVPARKSVWAGVASAQLLQTSLETFDGFSKEWGWSWGDVGCNLLGSGLFLSQELVWKEQRVSVKMSAMPVRYSDAPVLPVQPAGSSASTTLQARADALYGTGPVNLFLKNYNTLAVWVSVNPRSFCGEKAGWLPNWLNLAVGMGADHLFAGKGYTWQADKRCTGTDCLQYRLDPLQLPRTRQFFLSPDVDLTRIRVKGRFWKALLFTANLFKFPAPALEWRSGGVWRWHWAYF